MAVTQAEVLDLFAQAAAIKDNDQILLITSNQDQTVSPTKITAEVLKAYLSLGYSITIDSDGYLCINGQRTQSVMGVTPQVIQTSSTVSIKANTLNVWNNPVTALAVSFTAADDNVVNEYMLQFTVGSDNFSLVLPAAVKWVDGEAPLWENGYTYQVSIVNNLAVGAGWPNPQQEQS